MALFWTVDRGGVTETITNFTTFFLFWTLLWNLDDLNLVILREIHHFSFLFLCGLDAK
jgi:hypothetical protein